MADKGFYVFVRNWWRWEDGVRVPHPGAPETVLHQFVPTEEKARTLARAYNATHDEGPLSRKAEIGGRR